jgi:enoyl-CoA hydratase/carnithine racemase
MKNAFNFEMIENGIGILTFDYPDSKANKFNTATMTELNGKIDELAKKSEIKCLFFMTAKKGIFIA